MKTWNYNRTDTILVIRSAGTKFPPKYSDRNLILKTQRVKHMWLLGSYTASAVVSVSSKTQLARLIHSSLQQPLKHSTLVALFLYVLLLLYLSLSITGPCSPKFSFFISHFPMALNSVIMSVLQQLRQFHWLGV
jgi:hypothetical protein